MLAFSAKPVTELGKADVEAFLEAAPPENLFLELKQDLSERDGGPSQWAQLKGTISEKSRNEIAAEIVAFANGDGGTLVLGISETDDEPKRPKAINALPNPAALARKLHDKIVDIVEPPLSTFESVGITTEEDGGGIVILRVEPSTLAPHRLSTGEFQSYVRRDDKKRKMSMREIHDMVLQREFARSRFERVFAEIEARFCAGTLIEIAKGQAICHARWQIVVAPRRSVRVEISDIKLAPNATVAYQYPDRQPTWAEHEFGRTYFRSTPVLGGLAAAGDLSFAEPGQYGRRIREERFRDGRFLLSLEVTTDRTKEGKPKLPSLPAEWPAIWLVRALEWIAMVRRAAGEPALEFGLQFMTDNRHGFMLIPLGRSDGYYSYHSAWRGVEPNLGVSPIYEIGSEETMEATANDVFVDLVNSFGQVSFGERLLRKGFELGR